MFPNKIMVYALDYPHLLPGLPFIYSLDYPPSTSFTTLCLLPTPYQTNPHLHTVPTSWDFELQLEQVDLCFKYSCTHLTAVHATYYTLITDLVPTDLSTERLVEKTDLN